MKKCYIIVLNYKRWEDSVECIRSVFASTYAHFTLIVADNNSNNNSLENIVSALTAFPVTKRSSNEKIDPIHIRNVKDLPLTPAEFPELLLLQNASNRGFGAGNNLVLRLLLNEDAFIWLLNPDMVVNDTALEKLVHAGNKQPKAIIGAVTKSFEDPEKILFYGGGKINYPFGTVSLISKKEHINRMNYVSGGSMFLHSSHLAVLGLLPEDYFLYWEETDWCYNALKKGFNLQVCFEAICFDKISTSIGRGFVSDYFYTRNGLLFLSKYKPWWLLTASFAVFVRVLIRLFQGENKRAKGMVKGFIDFLTGGKYENK